MTKSKATKQATSTPNHMQPWLVISLMNGPEVVYAGPSEAKARKLYSEITHATIQNRVPWGNGSQIAFSDHK